MKPYIKVIIIFLVYFLSNPFSFAANEDLIAKKVDLPHVDFPEIQIPQKVLDEAEAKLYKTKKKLIKLNNKTKNYLMPSEGNKNVKKINATNDMLMSCPDVVNVDVQKISFGNEIAFGQISVIDPKRSNGNPGGRGANELVIYTPEYGLTTNTNEYGKEAIVVNNQVMAMGSMDSLIPKNGYVISGHGKGKQWIEKNIILGSKITINKSAMTITSMITPSTYVFEATEKIKEVQEINNYYKKRHYSMSQSDFYINKACVYLNYAKQSAKDLDIVMTKKYAKNSIIYANRAIACAVPFEQKELKGIWIRPMETSQVQIEATLDKLKELGINNIFLETYYHGMTIFPSKTMKDYGFPVQRKQFADVDLLKIWLNAAHKRNMKLHVWFQTFYLGNDYVSPVPKIMRIKHPDWLNRQHWCASAVVAQPSNAEHQGYFLDPANPEVQEYLITLLKEIATNYDIDGINIDYIRYPVAAPSNSPEYLAMSWGYTPYCMQEFKKLYGVMPTTILPNTQNWKRWEEFRQNKLTEFVQKLDEVRNTRHRMLFSAVVFPDKEVSASIKLQDWGTWAKNRYFDAFTPLFLSSNIDFTKKALREMKNITPPQVKIYAGLFTPFTQTDPTNLLLEIRATRELNADGVLIFDYAHFTKPYQQTVGVRAFNKYGK